MDREFFVRLWHDLNDLLIQTVHTPLQNDLELKVWVWLLFLAVILFTIISALYCLRKPH